MPIDTNRIIGTTMQGLNIGIFAGVTSNIMKNINKMFVGSTKKRKRKRKKYKKRKR